MPSLRGFDNPEEGLQPVHILSAEPRRGSLGARAIPQLDTLAHNGWTLSADESFLTQGRNAGVQGAEGDVRIRGKEEEEKGKRKREEPRGGGGGAQRRSRNGISNKDFLLLAAV